MQYFTFLAFMVHSVSKETTQAIQRYEERLAGVVCAEEIGRVMNLYDVYVGVIDVDDDV